MATRYCPVHSWATAGVRGNRACNNTDKKREQNQCYNPTGFLRLRTRNSIVIIEIPVLGGDMVGKIFCIMPNSPDKRGTSSG